MPKLLTTLSLAQRRAVGMAAAAAGESISEYVRQALGARMATEGFAMPDDLASPGERLAALARGEVFISVADCAASVARWRGAGRGNEWVTVIALNADELAASAQQSVEAQGGALTASGIYPCPPELAARAVWPE